MGPVQRLPVIILIPNTALVCMLMTGGYQEHDVRLDAARVLDRQHINAIGTAWTSQATTFGTPMLSWHTPVITSLGVWRRRGWVVSVSTGHITLHPVVGALPFKRATSLWAVGRSGVMQEK